MAKYTKKQNPAGWGDATKLVRGGLDRSNHGETSEAIYLTSGYVYDDPETAERRFAGEEEGYVYGRYGNPTVTMLEDLGGGLGLTDPVSGTAVVKFPTHKH